MLILRPLCWPARYGEIVPANPLAGPDVASLEFHIRCSLAGLLSSPPLGSLPGLGRT